MVVIDSDVLLLAFAYPNDERQKATREFLEIVQTAQPATTIYNVMETLGQLSFNLSVEQLDGWQDWLVNAYNLTIIWDTDSKEKVDPETWHEIIYERPFQKMQTVCMAFMDALILSSAEHAPDVECFVTWNAKHFKGKTNLTVLTPEEYLTR
jgi:predicted nucleic acid-binding protein